MLHDYPVEMLQTVDIAPRSLERAALSEAFMLPREQLSFT